MLIICNYILGLYIGSSSYSKRKLMKSSAATSATSFSSPGSTKVWPYTSWADDLPFASLEQHITPEVPREDGQATLRQLHVHIPLGFSSSQVAKKDSTWWPCGDFSSAQPGDRTGLLATSQHAGLHWQPKQLLHLLQDRPEEGLLSDSDEWGWHCKDCCGYAVWPPMVWSAEMSHVSRR